MLYKFYSKMLPWQRKNKNSFCIILFRLINQSRMTIERIDKNNEKMEKMYSNGNDMCYDGNDCWLWK